jgi:hypothetical protein
MLTDIREIESLLVKVLQDSRVRTGGMTELEKLVIASINQKLTYQQASVKYQYTESSFQNAASHLFKDLSIVWGTTVNRKNVLDLSEKAREAIIQNTNDGKFVFDRIQANFWVKLDRAQLVSVSYQASQALDLTEYLVKYSPNFRATFCSDVESSSSPLELLLHLCNDLQIPLPSPANDIQVLLKAVKLALQKRSTLLMLQFDQSNQVQAQWGDYVDILMGLGTIGNGTCLLVVQKEPSKPVIDLKQSLDYQVRLASNAAMGIQKEGVSKNKMTEARLISINNNQQIICDLLQTYLR